MITHCLGDFSSQVGRDTSRSQPSVRAYADAQQNRAVGTESVQMSVIGEYATVPQWVRVVQKLTLSSCHPMCCNMMQSTESVRLIKFHIRTKKVQAKEAVEACAPTFRVLGSKRSRSFASIIYPAFINACFPSVILNRPLFIVRHVHVKLLSKDDN